MKTYVIRIGAKTFYRYGGNTRDVRKALIFSENEIEVARNIVKNLGSKARIIQIN